MAWEWVGAVAAAAAGGLGTFFTWLTGKQGRTHAAELAADASQQARRERLESERRDTYLGLLRLADINARREKYERRGDEVKLADVERLWPRATRIEMLIDMEARLELYGSPEARQVVEEWNEQPDPHDPDTFRDFREKFLTVAQRVLGLADLWEQASQGHQLDG